MPENPIIPISKEGLELFKKSLSTTAPNTSQFEGTFGEHVLDSQFDTGLKPGMNREDYLGEVQPISDKLANAVPRLLSKVGTEIVKTPGYLYALGEAGLTDKTLAESLDNAWINAAQHFDDATKEQFAIYKPKVVREGNLWDNFTSASFWTDEGVDGVGFLLSMMAPGAALKATGLATKLAKVPGLAKIGTANIELGQATLLNTALESAAETKGIVDNLKQEFNEKIDKEINPNTGKLWTAEEAKQAIGDAAVNTFAMNMGLLIVPNTIMNKNLLGRFKTSNKILDDLRDPITGKFVANNPLAKKSLIKEYAKHVGEATASEGFLEEAGQTTIENYNSKVALNKTNAGVLEGLASEYINTLSTTEGQKSILLGAVLGALGGAVGKSRELKQEAQERSVLTKLIKDNFEGFSTEMNNLFVKDPSGKVELDPKTNSPKINMEEATKVISNLVKEQQSTNLQDLAAINGEKDLYDYIYNQQLARFALPYLKQEGGLEILNQHIEDTSKILSEKAKQFSKETDFSENEFKNNTKKTLQELQRNYDSIYSTVSELGLERLSDNPKHVELFANKIANVAYAETAKQMFLVDKIKELNQELTHLNISSTTDLPQTKIEKTKLEGRIKELSNNLNKSIKEYESIFDKKEQEKAFLNFSNKVTELEKEIDAATKKDEKKVKAEEKKAEKAATTGVVEKTKEEKEAEELKKSTAEKDFYMSEALAATSLKEFNAFKPALDKHVLVSTEEKAKLTEHENKLKQAEGVDTTEDNTTQEDVSTFLNENTVTSKVTADEQVTVSYKEIQQGKFRDLIKGISKVANVVMMRLFKHHFEDGMFKFTRDKNGLPDVDNNSGLDIDALNTIKVGDTVEFKLVELNDKAKDLFDKSQKDSIEKIEEHIKDGNLYGYSSKDNYGFDNKHIGIFNSDGKLIGFFQQPHAISGEVEGDVLDSYIISRGSIIRQRAFIINQLSKGEQVTSEVTDKGIGNLYTKLTPDGKIDPINKVLDTARDKDKLDNNLIFVVNNGEKLELPILENANHTAEVEASIAELGAWGKKGSVYQLVKDTNDNWVPIPVYAELINESVINSIMDRLSTLPEDIDPIVVVRALNPFIYTSTHKKVSLQVTRELGITNLTINGKTFTLSSVINTRKQEFIKELKTKRQNIEIKNINSSETQALLKERGALITNATTYNGEYFVQPYIAFEDVTKGKVEKADKETKEESKPETKTQGSIEDILNSRGINPEDLTKDDAFSRTEFFDPDSTNTVDKVKITNWLKENLPGLSLFNAREVKELKTNIKDAVGMYKDMVIYLFNHSSNKTAYHEAFHGVFRNMLSPNERLVLIDEFAKTQMFKPTKANLEYIQEGYKKKFTDEQLTYLYYEELLADAFADYSDTFEPKKLSQRIIDFFDKILRFFGWYISPITSNKLDELFYKINTGKYAKASLKAKQKVVNRPLSHFKDDNYVWKRIPGLGATFKATRVKSIGDSFIAEYWKKVNTGTNPKEIKPSEIYGKFDENTQSFYPENSIFAKYQQLIQKAATDKSISNDLIIDAAKVINNSAAIVAEANRYIGTFGIKVKADNLEYEEQKVSFEEEDVEVSTTEAKTTKSHGQDMVSIPGLKSASTRLKMFLSGIPVLDKGITKKDAFDFPVFHDFLGVYYFLERNLTDLNTFDEMIEELDSLSKIRPEVAIIKTKLLDGDGTMTKEQLRLLQNDFKANFSKQQLVYTLVKFDTDSVTGAVTFKVMDANRQTIKREIYDAWVSNLINPSRNTIAKHNPDGSVQPYGTDAAKALLNRWKTSIKKDMSYEDFNDILLEIGIEFSPEVLKKLLNDKVFIVNVTSVLDWYAAEKPEEKEINGKKALEKLVNYEVTNMLNNYTQSFNNVENKAIYTIQLPSFASKLLSKLTNKNGNKFNQAYNELLKEDSYKHSNLLNELKKDLKFRQEGFKLSYLDGLKDERGNSEGAKFTNMSPKDFLYMQLALFDNNAETKKEQITENLAKYIYLTPADKTMSMIFDAKKYAVYMEADKVKISPIVNAFYNVVLQEASRVQQALKLKNGDIEGDKLLENYHYLKSSPPTKNADGTWNINWNGQAFRFNYFKHVNKALYDKIEEALNNNLTEDVEKVLQPFKGEIVNSLLEDLNEEVDLTVAEAKFKQVDATKQKLADFALNTWLFNIEASKLLNGDPAIYKDLAKRTYQSGSMTVSSNTISHPKVRTRVVKDLKLDLSEQHGEDYNDVNVTDAQVYWTPEFYKKWHEMRGTWNADMQLAYDIAEGNIKPTPEQLKAARGKLVGVKPFYFGNRFDENLGIHRYEQVKTAVLPLFKSYIKDNPLLAEKRKEMEDSGLDMIAHESAFKAAIGYRTLIDSNDFVTLELDMDNFGTQVDNPNHILDEENSSLRQLKMLLLGNIDPNKEYNGTSGEQLQFEINQLEGINITEDLDKLKKLINHPTDSTFRTFIVDQLTRRGATENLQQVLEIVNGEFKYPPDLGPSSTPFENLISSIFTDKVVKQSFLGASAVQATALGLQFKNLGQQQKAIDKSAVLTKMQTSLKWVRPGEGDKVEYAEAYMPAWAEEYFDKDGNPKDNIPDELREILIYRIPTEGYHSMLPVKVVGFMPPELGNFIMLPYEITTQFGADFDFDKVYFIAPEFYKDNAGNLFKVKYDESKSAEDNTRKARNNRILDNYMKVLSSKETYPLLIKKSGFDLLTKLKEAIEGASKKKVNFYSSRTQRDLKLRNHVGLGLKGQSALHVSGHSFATMLGLNTKQISLDGKIINDNIFRFNNHETFDLNRLYNTNGELIADELSSMMAAILDDIKDPILEPLGINQFTIDVWSTIVRAGFGTETAINLIASPVIKELSTKLEENTYKIKGLDFEWNSVNSLLSQYDTLLNAVLTKLSNEDRQEIQSELDKKDAKNLDDKSMKFWRDWHGKNEDKLHVTSDPEHNKMLAKYYIYQFRVLNNFGRYDSIAKDLVKINRFFSINKEVGPNIEDIIEKKYLFREVSNPGFTIKGMENMANVDSLNAQYDVQLAALDFFKKYFPYDTPEYKRLKNSIAQKQYGKDLLSISAENRQAINGFIRTYLDGNFNYFHDVNNSKTKQRLFVDLPKKIGFIQNPKNDKKYFDGKLRENPFIKQLTVRNEKGLGYISLKGNRLDLHIKDNLIEAFEQLWRNPDTKDLMVDLIKHSFAATGFYSGLNSFHSYIPISVWEEIGYDAYRKNRTAILQEEFILGRDQKENLIDQLIRNFPKKFTKVFEESMFTEQDGLLWTSSELIAQAKKERDMILGDRFVDYLRVYNKTAKKSLLYRQTQIPGVYELVSSLGKSGRMIEINVDAEIKTSIIADNNTALKEDKPNKEGTPINNKGEEIEYTPYEDVTDVDTNEPIAQPVLESGQLALPSPEGLDEWLEKNPPKTLADFKDDLFGNVLPPSQEDINNLPPDIEPC